MTCFPAKRFDAVIIKFVLNISPSHYEIYSRVFPNKICSNIKSFDEIPTNLFYWMNKGQRVLSEKVK